MNRLINKEQRAGVLILLLSKTFERLAFYLIMAILIQYLTDSLKLGTDKAGLYYSILYGTIGLTTFFSGLIGDLYNRMRIVKVGFILLTVIYLALAFLPDISIVIIIALILLGLGIGLTTPNTIVFLGNIFNERENQIIGLPGFILFTVTINIGALLAPLLSIFLKNNLGYDSIFIFAFVFAFISLILFLKFKTIYNKLNLLSGRTDDSAKNASVRRLNTIILISVLSLGVFIRFALAQKGLSFTFFVRDYLDNGFRINQNLNGIEKYISIILFVLFTFAIIRIKKLNWQKVFNIILIGTIVCAISFIIIASFEILSSFLSGNTIFHNAFILLLIAETLIYPTILYVIYRSSPLKYKGLFQGISYISVSISTSLLFFGPILYENTNISITFTVFTAILLFSASLIIVLKKIIKKKMIEIESDKEIMTDNIEKIYNETTMI